MFEKIKALWAGNRIDPVKPSRGTREEIRNMQRVPRTQATTRSGRPLAGNSRERSQPDFGQRQFFYDDSPNFGFDSSNNRGSGNCGSSSSDYPSSGSDGGSCGSSD